MNLAHLYYFKRLAEKLHFTKTAEELYITQSTLSLAISNLENELDAPLFYRKKGAVKLTEYGEVFYQYATAALNMLDNGVDVLNERLGKENNSIRIGVTSSAQSRQWSNLMRTFRHSQPGEIQLDLKQTTTPNILAGLQKGTLDVGFCGQMDTTAEIALFPLWAHRACLLVSTENPLSKRSGISLEEVADTQIITYTKDGAGIGYMVEELVQDFELNIRFSFADEISACALVAANPKQLALACNLWLIKAFEGEVVPVPITELTGALRRVYLAYRLDVVHPKIVQDFIETAMNEPFDDLE